MTFLFCFIVALVELVKVEPENANYGVNRIYLYLKVIRAVTTQYIGYAGRTISSSDTNGDRKD